MNSKIKNTRSSFILHEIRKTPLYVWMFRIILIFLGIVFLYPLIFAIQTSFKTMTEFYNDMWALPEKLLFENYAVAWV